MDRMIAEYEVVQNFKQKDNICKDIRQIPVISAVFTVYVQEEQVLHINLKFEKYKLLIRQESNKCNVTK